MILRAIGRISLLILFMSAGLAINLLVVRTELLNFIPILFYRGIVAALVAAVLQTCLMLTCELFLSSKIAEFTGQSTQSIIALTFAVAITFLIVFPVSIDRSVTVFLLGELEKAGSKGLTEKELEELLIQRYVVEFGAVQRRLEEQQYSSLVEADNDHYRLTGKAHEFLKAARLIARLYGTRNQILSPQEPTTANP